MPDQITVTLPEIIGGAVTTLSILSASLYALKKRGLITIGEPKERRKCSSVCLEHSNLATHVKENAERLKEQEDKLDGMSKDISAIRSSVAGIEGYLKGISGGI